MKRLLLIIWITFFIAFGLFLYVNFSRLDTLFEIKEHSIPDDIVEEWSAKEKVDLQELTIPNWAKFIRVCGDKLFIILFLVGFILYIEMENKGAFKR
jgi:YbbR domain-containing protein